MSSEISLWSVNTADRLLQQARQVARAKGLSFRPDCHTVFVEANRQEGMNTYKVGSITARSRSFWGICFTRVQIDFRDIEYAYNTGIVMKFGRYFSVREGTDLKEYAPLLMFLKECLSKSDAHECVAPFQPREPA